MKKIHTVCYWLIASSCYLIYHMVTYLKNGLGKATEISPEAGKYIDYDCDSSVAKGIKKSITKNGEKLT